MKTSWTFNNSKTICGDEHGKHRCEIYNDALFILVVAIVYAYYIECHSTCSGHCIRLLYRMSLYLFWPLYTLIISNGTLLVLAIVYAYYIECHSTCSGHCTLIISNVTLLVVAIVRLLIKLYNNFYLKKKRTIVLKFLNSNLLLTVETTITIQLTLNLFCNDQENRFIIVLASNGNILCAWNKWSKLSEYRSHPPGSICCSKRDRERVLLTCWRGSSSWRESAVYVLTC